MEIRGDHGNFQGFNNSCKCSSMFANKKILVWCGMQQIVLKAQSDDLGWDFVSTDTIRSDK